MLAAIPRSGSEEKFIKKDEAKLMINKLSSKLRREKREHLAISTKSAVEHLASGKATKSAPLVGEKAR